MTTPHHPNQGQGLPSQQQHQPPLHGGVGVGYNFYPPMAAANQTFATSAAYQQQQQQAALRYYQQQAQQVQQQQQRTAGTGNVYVGGATVIHSRPASATNNGAAPAVRTSTVAVAAAEVAPPPPPGKYINETLKFLGGSESSSNGTINKKKRRSDYISDLERLIPPLFSQSAVHSTSLSIILNHADTKKDRGAELTTAEQQVSETKGEKEGAKIKQGDEEEDSSNQHSSNIKRLKIQLEQCQQQNINEMKRRQKIVSSFISFHTMYESGLDFISRMGDLRNVPDNVMPDEIPKSV